MGLKIVGLKIVVLTGVAYPVLKLINFESEITVQQLTIERWDLTQQRMLRDAQLRDARRDSLELKH